MQLSNSFYGFSIVPSPYTLLFMMTSINLNLMYEVHLHFSFEFEKKKKKNPVRSAMY